MEPWIEYLPGIAASVALFGAAAAGTIHALIRKSDTRAAVGWIGLMWLSPVVGIIFYILFGVNRIRRQAKTMRRNLPSYKQPDRYSGVDPDELSERLGAGQHLVALARVSEETTGRKLVGGNLVEPLRNGDEAYAQMLDAIDRATSSVTLMSYIFQDDAIGRRFVEALERAVARGVEVRVLVDAAGSRYSFPTVVRALKKRGVRAARFMRSSLFPPYILSFNLRNHRKTLVVDGVIGFTGGINIRDDCVLDADPKFPTRDLHFRVEGPIVAQLQEVFAEDWTFTTREELQGEPWFPTIEPVGDVVARGIPDGPDEDLDKLRWMMLAAVGSARDSIEIVTPYFLPDEPLIEALIVAAMRGVQVDVVMPKSNNLPYVEWAAMGQIYPLLKRGVRVWFHDGPFDHSKVFVVDRQFVLFGSPNWDPRSLRLNFEFAVEAYDSALAEDMSEYARERIRAGRQWTADDHRQRGWMVRIRDGIFRLGAPYL